MAGATGLDRAPRHASRSAVAAAVGAVSAAQHFPRFGLGGFGAERPGAAAHSARLIPSGLVPLSFSRYLPELREVEFVVIGPGQHHYVASALMSAILRNAGRLQQIT